MEEFLFRQKRQFFRCGDLRWCERMTPVLSFSFDTKHKCARGTVRIATDETVCVLFVNSTTEMNFCDWIQSRRYAFLLRNQRRLVNWVRNRRSHFGFVLLVYRSIIDNLFFQFYLTLLFMILAIYPTMSSI